MLNKKRLRDRTARASIGWVVFFALAVFTAVEFGIGALVRPSAPYLTATALVKAALIVYYFMHVAQLWKREAGRR